MEFERQCRPHCCIELLLYFSDVIFGCTHANTFCFDFACVAVTEASAELFSSIAVFMFSLCSTAEIDRFAIFSNHVGV